MRILFVTANRLGDAVLSTGLLDHLIRTWPTARFTVACGPVAEGVFQRMPGLERIIVIEKQSFGRHWLG
ncbi:MAG TPA: glycosyltransferase family 9 protein, partial [Acetobacteraceae bacterium]|nr:glycosyltransferase family 9 protein [Acetobacteraceae bacterium]